MTILDSSAIHAATYDPERSVLTIEFASSGTYDYFAVPRSKYEALISAPSAGLYFFDNIRDRYPFKKREDLQKRQA